MIEEDAPKPVSETLEEEEIHGRPDPEEPPVASPIELPETPKKPWWKFW